MTPIVFSFVSTASEEGHNKKKDLRFHGTFFFWNFSKSFCLHDPPRMPYVCFGFDLVIVENYTQNASALSACNCYQECTTVSYDVSVTTAMYPAQHIVQDLVQSINKSEEWIK